MITKTIKKESFLKAVKKELLNIKKYATKDEIFNLVDGIKKFGLANLTNRCVYGIMTGNCDGERGCELVEKCASEYKLNYRNFSEYLSYSNLESLQFNKHRKRSNDIIYRSYVEVLLVMDKKKLLDMIHVIFKEEFKSIEV